jgi:PmbA protein
MSDELADRAAQAVELAQAKGAQAAWANASRSRGLSIELRNGTVEKVQENVSRSLSLRLWVDGRFTAHSTTDLTPARLEEFVEQAVALTRALEPDPDRLITDPKLYEGRPTADLELVDANLSGRTLEQRISDCERMNEKARTSDRVISASSSAYDGHYRSAAASSNGFADAYEATYVGLSTDVTLRDEGDKRPEAGMYMTSRHAGDLLDAEQIGQLALERATVRLGTRKGPTLATTMVVDRLAAARLIGELLGPANGYSLQQNSSFWQGHLSSRGGKRSVAKRLTITDEPLRPRGLASRPFDGEGIAARTLPIIEGGKLRNVYLDTYYAKKLGMAPTTGGPSNRVVALGKRELSAIVTDVGTGIYVTSWLGGNSDYTTGDFSFGMRGHLIEGGKIGAAVGEMNVTGNLLELFSRLVEVGNDPWPFSSTLVPTLVFENVQFSGS